MEIKLRNATDKDLPSILTIVNHSILNTTAIYDYEARTLAQQKVWFDEKINLGWPIIVAQMNNDIIGFGTYGSFRVKIAYQFTVEHSVYVSENFIGKGVGKMLLAQLIVIAKSQNYHAMIGCIDAENKGSIAFHEKFGFKISGTLKQVGFKFKRWLDLVLMQLLLK